MFFFLFSGKTVYFATISAAVLLHLLPPSSPAPPPPSPPPLPPLPRPALLLPRRRLRLRAERVTARDRARPPRVARQEEEEEAPFAVLLLLHRGSGLPPPDARGRVPDAGETASEDSVSVKDGGICF